MTSPAGVDPGVMRRVLLLAPTAKDAQVTTKILSQARLECVACESLHRLSREIEFGVGAILLTSEALTADGFDELTATLTREPTWSEPPIVVLTADPDLSPVPASVLRALRNITVLERPAPLRTVISALHAALRGRERQYQIRDQLQALEAAEQHARELQQQLELAIDASELGTFHCRVPLDKLVWNERCKAHFWLPADAEVDLRLFYSILHCDDRERTRRAVEACVYDAQPFDIEYRTMSKSGAVRWIRSTGRTYYDGSGAPVRFDGTTQDVTQRKLREEELRTASQRKDEFLAMLAHELRNPLTPIRNSVEIMRTLGAKDGRIGKAVDIVDRQVQHLARLVDDLLDVSRVTQGKVLLQRQTLDLTDVIYRGIELARPLVDGKRHTLAITLPPAGEAILDGDATRLAQVIGNLLDNAAKYTEEGGAIDVCASRRDGIVELRVRDNGLGIAPDLLPHVFDMFVQAEQSLDRAQGGLGIGLSLVRSLVELHGGTVEAKSEGPGKGSEFIVRLPAARTRRMRDSGTPASAAAALEVNRVLVVDDNIDAAETLRMLLEMEGHQVRCAYESAQAFELALSFRPDIALLDIGLPRMDGFELARRLRARPELKRTRLIAVTGYGQPEDRSRALAAGFDIHVTKPVDPRMLRSLVSRAVEAAPQPQS